MKRKSKGTDRKHQKNLCEVAKTETPPPPSPLQKRKERKMLQNLLKKVTQKRAIFFANFHHLEITVPVGWVLNTNNKVTRKLARRLRAPRAVFLLVGLCTMFLFNIIYADSFMSGVNKDSEARRSRKSRKHRPIGETGVTGVT